MRLPLVQDAAVGRMGSKRSFAAPCTNDCYACAKQSFAVSEI